MDAEQRAVALVTGAGRSVGIGAAICRELAARGADICFTTWPAYDNAMPWGAEENWPQDFERELGALGSRVLHVEVDLSEAVAAERLLERVTDDLGPLAIVVNNAAHSVNAGIGEIDARTLDDHYAVNLRAMALLCAGFVRRWRGSEGGRIINITSGQSLGPMPDELPYVATKGAIEAFTSSLAPAIAGMGITVNAVNPGPTDTGWMNEALEAELLPRFPMGRIGRPEDAARLVGFLCSPEASWITGQVIHSEGGFLRS